MRHVLAILVSGIGVSSVLAQPAQTAGSQFAILVACASYHDRANLPALPHTVLEMDEFRAALEKTGFEPANIKFIQDKPADNRLINTRESIIKQLKLLLGRVEANDTVVIAFAGHGVHFKDEPHGYFCPINANILDKKTLIPMEGEEGVFDLLKACKAKRKLLIVNACRNDPINSGMAARKIEFDNTKEEEVPEGIAAIYSCKAGQKSYFYPPDSPHKNRSLFFHHLIEAWRGAYTQGPPTLEEVFALVKRKTAADADNVFNELQIPQVRREYQGEWKIGPVIPKKPDLVDSTGGALSEETVKRLQKEWAAYLKTPVEVEVDLGGGEKMTFVLVPPGKFKMGASDAEKNDKSVDSDESPRHEVEITQPMYVSKYSTTRGQFRRFAAATSFAENGGSGWNEGKGNVESGSQYTWKDPGFSQTDAHPVVNVSWHDAQKYCAWLVSRAQVAGFSKVRLLREGEWEYSCRAGTVTRHYLSDDPEDLAKIGNVYDGSGKAKLKGSWESIKADDGYAFTSPVGRYRANGFGLHDMIGNVWQWCEDGKREYTSGKQTDPDGGSAGASRVSRGGSFDFDSRLARAANRDVFDAGDRFYILGFRVVLVR